MGPHGIMTAVIQGIRPFVTHFSLDQENNKLHLYNKIDNHNLRKCMKHHNHKYNNRNYGPFKILDNTEFSFLFRTPLHTDYIILSHI